MSTAHDIEKRIKENFENQDFEIQEAWLDDMSTKLDDLNKKPKRKFGIWIFLVGGILLTTVATVLWYENAMLSTKNSIAPLKQQVESLKEEKPENYIAKNIPYDLNCAAEIRIEKTKVRLEKQNKKNNTETTLETNKKHKKQSNNLAEKEKFKNISKRQNAQTVSNQKNKNDDLKAQKNNFVAQKENIQSSLINKNTSTENDLENKLKETKTSNLLAKENAMTTTITLESETVLALNKTTEKPIEKRVNQTAKSVLTAENISNNLSKENKNILETKTNNTKTIEALDSLKKVVVEEKQSTKDSLNLKTEDKNKQKQTEKKNLGLSLAINAGPSIVFRSYTSTTQHKKRTSEEKIKLGWNANLELYKTFKNKLILGTGIQVNNYGEKIAYSQINTALLDTNYATTPKDYLNLNIKRLIDSSGQSFYNYDTTAIVYNDSAIILNDSIYENTSVTKSNRNTQFTYIEIPVLIGYKILDSKKFDIVASTGVSIGFLIHSKGNYINPAETLETAKNTDINFNFLLNAQFRYKLYKNLSLSFSPNFKYNINQQSKLLGTQKRYSSFGINGGIILDF